MNCVPPTVGGSILPMEIRGGVPGSYEVEVTGVISHFGTDTNRTFMPVLLAFGRCGMRNENMNIFLRNVLITAVIIVSGAIGVMLTKNRYEREMNNPSARIDSSRTYNSAIKTRVKELGGNVDGALRFSIQWNDTTYNPNDFDAHCIEPDGNEISFKNMINRNSGGNLDVDIIDPVKGEAAVENIAWASARKMQQGDYEFFVHCYSYNGGKTGFSAEIEFDGKIYPFVHTQALRQNEKVPVVKINYSTKNGFRTEREYE